MGVRKNVMWHERHCDRLPGHPKGHIHTPKTKLYTNEGVRLERAFVYWGGLSTTQNHDASGRFLIWTFHGILKSGLLGRFCVWGDPWHDSNGLYDGNARFVSEIICLTHCFVFEGASSRRKNERTNNCAQQRDVAKTPFRRKRHRAKPTSYTNGHAQNPDPTQTGHRSLTRHKSGPMKSQLHFGEW